MTSPHQGVKGIVITILIRRQDLETNRFLHDSLLKIWDFFHEWNEWKDAEFLSRVEEIPDLQ